MSQRLLEQGARIQIESRKQEGGEEIGEKENLVT
jgi:hypothetical protein